MKKVSKKSVLKRIRITKRGILIRRPMGINHFKAKKSGAETRHKRKMRTLDASMAKIIKSYI